MCMIKVFASLAKDGVHPTAEGYEIMAALLLEQL